MIKTNMWLRGENKAQREEIAQLKLNAAGLHREITRMRKEFVENLKIATSTQYSGRKTWRIQFSDGDTRKVTADHYRWSNKDTLFYNYADTDPLHRTICSVFHAFRPIEYIELMDENESLH